MYIRWRRPGSNVDGGRRPDGSEFAQLFAERISIRIA
jgi:hypothetical protein